MKALIDGDILLYRIGYTTQEENEGVARHRMDELISRILDGVQATSYEVYLSCGRLDSFRAKMNPQYKANRTQEKPKHYAMLKQHLIDKWAAIVAKEEEADDLIGINLKGEDTVACTIDKDILYGLEGFKYNFVKEEKFYIDKDTADLFFYKQMLMGDTADNIPGVPGIGLRKAEKALNELLGEDELVLFDKVFEIYYDYYASDFATEMEEELPKGTTVEFDKIDLAVRCRIKGLMEFAGKMLKIRTYEGEVWSLPEKRK